MKAFFLAGTSMWPALKAGDIALCEEGGAAPRPGDLVVREIAGVAYAHRYLGPGLTKGDRLRFADPEPGSEETFRKVVAVRLRRGGKLFRVDAPGSLTPFLSSLQMKIAIVQLRADSRLARAALAPSMLACGLMLRSWFYVSGRSEG